MLLLAATNFYACFLQEINAQSLSFTNVWILLNVVNTTLQMKMMHECSNVRVTSCVKTDFEFSIWKYEEEIDTRANYSLEWEIKIYSTTFSPFTFLFNHRISNFPPFFTNLWKKDFFSPPGPPGWQSTMLANRPGTYDI